MGNMGDLAILLVGIVDALFAFFVVAPILLNTASLFGVQKRFAQAMVEEGVIDAATVKQMHSKKQIAGVLISLVLCAVLEDRTDGLPLRRRGAGGRVPEVPQDRAVQQPDRQALPQHLQGPDECHQVQQVRRYTLLSLHKKRGAIAPRFLSEAYRLTCNAGLGELRRHTMPARIGQERRQHKLPSLFISVKPSVPQVLT